MKRVYIPSDTYSSLCDWILDYRPHPSLQAAQARLRAGPQSEAPPLTLLSKRKPAMFAGLEGGGARTAFAPLERDGQVRARGEEGSAYYREVGTDGAAAVLARGCAARSGPGIT